MGVVAGGDVRQFKYGGREFEVAPECAFEMNPSIRATEYKKSGNSQLVGIQKNELAVIDGIELVCRNKKADFEYFRDAASAGEPKAVNITLADGSTWSGSMGVEGLPKYKTDSGQVAITLKGVTLEQI